MMGSVIQGGMFGQNTTCRAYRVASKSRQCMRVHAQPQEAPAKVGKAKAVPGKEQEAKEIHGSTSRMAPPGHEGNNPGPEAEVHTKIAEALAAASDAEKARVESQENSDITAVDTSFLHKE
eukprot:jgi/Astpho2/8091/Aster-03035